MVKAKKLSAKKEKQIVRDRTILEWVLLVVLLLLAYFFLAQSYNWWPYDTVDDDLGSAFYTTQNALKDVNGNDLADANGTNGNGSGENGSGTTGSANNTGGGSTGNTGPRGGSGSNGGNGSNGGGGTATPTPATPTTPANPSTQTPSLLSFAAQVNTGMTREQLNVAANGLNQGCTVVVNTASVGKQEVCLYTVGNQTATVTLLNDRVVSASLSN